MYLRHSTVRKDGKEHTYWRLVRSVRRDGKVVQETVAQLGELDAQGRLRAEALARRITGRADQYELFEERPGAEQAIAVRLDRVRLERARRFGDVWLWWTLWRARGLDSLCTELMGEGRAEVPWPTVAAVLVISRLPEPSSCRRLRTHPVSSAFDASCGPTRPKLSRSTASASACPNDYGYPQTPSKCSANFRVVGGLTH